MLQTIREWIKRWWPSVALPLNRVNRYKVKYWVALGTIGLALGLSSCGDSGRSPTTSARIIKRMTEVSPPVVIQALTSLDTADTAKPQVTILSPRPDDVIESDNIDVRLQVKGFKLYQDETFGLGPHLNIFIDNEFYGSIYDISNPLELKGLAPGTHTLRAIATSAWNESIKTADAYAQTTFHIFTKTPLVEPPEGLPLLTFNQPSDDYGAEPILLDYYVNPVPVSSDGEEELALTPQGWKVRATINGEPFIFDQWESIYLKGFKSGKNWVQLELLDANDQAIESLFNNTARIIEYHPGDDTFIAQLMRDELSIEEVGVIVDPNYVPPAPELEVKQEDVEKVDSTPEDNTVQSARVEEDQVQGADSVVGSGNNRSVPSAKTEQETINIDSAKNLETEPSITQAMEGEEEDTGINPALNKDAPAPDNNRGEKSDQDSEIQDISDITEPERQENVDSIPVKATRSTDEEPLSSAEPSSKPQSELNLLTESSIQEGEEQSMSDEVLEDEEQSLSIEEDERTSPFNRSIEQNQPEIGLTESNETLD